MNYTLTNPETEGAQKTDGILDALKKLWPLMVQEKGRLVLAFFSILINSGLTILAPILIGHAVDNYIGGRNFHGIVVYAVYLFLIYIGILVSSFFQTRTMGNVGQRVLFRLRNAIFMKLQELPVAFFNQNKAGDLISRINNDTDKLNQFFSQSLMQFVGNVFVIIGAGIAMLVVNTRVGVASLVPALVLLVFVRITSAWVKRTNFVNMQALGGMSAEIQESLQNFKVIIAFNRRDYFRKRFQEVNENNYRAAIRAGISSNTYVPVFGLASNMAQLIMIVYGLHLIASGAFTFGLLISYLAYVSRFYDPLRQMAALWSNLQTALAGWDRISEILAMESDLAVIPGTTDSNDKNVIEFKDVSFSYPGGHDVLKDISFAMEPGKTYALVGPTGGGKTTTASLLARLYDPSKGTVLLSGKDIRSYEHSERTKKIGFILQDPFLFTGTLRDNILYGNEDYLKHSNAKILELLKGEGLDGLMERFDQGLDTPISASSDTMSLGQKQLIAFIRAVLRHPDLLILDEATANIDTVTEQLLDEILQHLPEKTTKVVIAHRLNTIENADEIFFVNGGRVTLAGSLEQAVKMLSKGVRES